MKIIHPADLQVSDSQRALFMQGAGAIACEGGLSAALWHEHTPEHQGRKIGAIGACQLDDSPDAAEFLAACADHLQREHQCRTVVGPMNGNTWLQHRLILESNGRDPFLMEPVEPAHFLNVFRQAGFSVLSEYSSSSVDLTTSQNDHTVLAKRLLEKGISIRALEMSRFEHDLEAIFDVSLVSFSNNFLYTALSKEVFVGKYKQSKEHIDPDLVLLAERDGELMAYVFCMPDLLAVQAGKPPALIVKTLAALPDRSLSGLGSLLVGQVQQTATAKGYTEAIHALQYDDNSSRRISQRFNAQVFRRYGLMAKTYP